MFHELLIFKSLLPASVLLPAVVYNKAACEITHTNVVEESVAPNPIVRIWLAANVKETKVQGSYYANLVVPNASENPPKHALVT